MAEQKQKQNQPERQGQGQQLGEEGLDPSQRREGQSGTQREQSERGTGQREQTTERTPETRNKPEGNIEGQPERV